MSVTDPIKGAGTTFWRLKDGQSIVSVDDYQLDEKWERLAQIREFTPGELSVTDEDDSYLDDEDVGWTRTAPGVKSAGSSTLILAWKPGEAGQQKLIDDYDKGVITLYRAKYPNGVVDAWNSYINKLGKAVTSQQKITRTVTIMHVGKPKTAEELLVGE